jgi:CheY-like chemotaxis protein
MAHVMEAGPLDPKQRERLEVIKTSGESLLSVLNDMLDFAKIEAGYLKLSERAFDLAPVLAAACNPFAAIAAAKGIAFNVTVAPSAGGQWRGDDQRLRQIVSNLTANAVKFTEAGAVVVAVDATETGLRIVVRDTGIGMRPDQIPRLFEKFTQADSSNTRKFGGTGLGLAICRDLTNLMGGTLTAISAENEGSAFTFEAPLAHQQAGSVEKSPPAPAAPAGDRQLRVLAADDNLVNQDVLLGLLAPLGAEVVMTKDGEAAVAAFRKGRFDVVLMDIHMPRMNGMEATRLIRAWEAQQGLPPTPVLAVTANLMTHHVGAYLAAGMDGVVAKPIQIDKLFAALGDVLPMKKAA